MQQNRTPRRGTSYVVLTLLSLGVAAAGSWEAAIRIADRVETRTGADIRNALALEDLDWASVRTDGLMVRLDGTAPDEVARFRALSAANGLIDSRRIIDEMTVAERELLEPPDFKLEVMRQGDQFSMIGLVPARTDREDLAADIASATGDITDLTSTAAFPPPDGWQQALDFAVTAADIIRQGTISVTPGAVSVTANAVSEADKARIEAMLTDAASDSVALSANIISPLPVIAPFTLRITRNDEGAVLENCSAANETDREAILTAAASAGVTGSPDCAIGIGAPAGWTEAAILAMDSIARAGGGTADLTDETIRITLPWQISEDDLTAETERLSAALPQGFSVAVGRAERTPDGGPPHFTVSMDGEGPAALAGVVPDDTMRQTVLSLARAQLGPIEGELVLNPALPEGWALRVMAGLDATGSIDIGQVEITPDVISIDGISGDRLATEKAVLALATRLGAGSDYSVAIAYDRMRDPELALPDGVECVDRMNTVMLQSQIGFEPGGSRIAGDISPVIDQFRPIMNDCSDYLIEIAGHTDAQGGDDSNMRLSIDRAEAILTALQEADLPVGNMTAQGYGETRPIAENDTEEGREANRRIELTLLSPQPVSPPLDISPAITGTTPTAEAATAALLAASPPDPVAMPDGTTDAAIAIPEGPFDEDALSAPPKIEPPAEVLEATPETPRPPDRPEDAHPEAEDSDA
ncbi:OmpA family protein [Paracoccus aerodenitrificans]|uniref:OmpA family protein n=1 Tax=Paracoccus aerodenitrificans TaxID=3017781 RepID=UPI0022F06D91|nr:OmpA family protein [Paracoccus aerodenitrificans]WBU62830.1 OmpA family protein [Paracoccus aerodenitrificans]